MSSFETARARPTEQELLNDRRAFAGARAPQIAIKPLSLPLLSKAIGKEEVSPTSHIPYPSPRGNSISDMPKPKPSSFQLPLGAMAMDLGHDVSPTSGNSSARMKVLIREASTFRSNLIHATGSSYDDRARQLIASVQHESPLMSPRATQQQHQHGYTTPRFLSALGSPASGSPLTPDSILPTGLPDLSPGSGNARKPRKTRSKDISSKGSASFNHSSSSIDTSTHIITDDLSMGHMEETLDDSSENYSSVEKTAQPAKSVTPSQFLQTLGPDRLSQYLGAGLGGLGHRGNTQQPEEPPESLSGGVGGRRKKELKMQQLQHHKLQYSIQLPGGEDGMSNLDGSPVRESLQQQST